MKKTYTLNNSQVSADEIRRLLKENPELLEEKGYKPWRAEEREEYWFVDNFGDVRISDESEHRADDFRHLISNYFRTQEEAEAHKARLEAIGRVTHAILTANKGWILDWRDVDERKHYIYYNHWTKGFCRGVMGQHQGAQTLPFAKSSEIAERIITDHEDDLRIIFKLD